MLRLWTGRVERANIIFFSRRLGGSRGQVIGHRGHGHLFGRCGDPRKSRKKPGIDRSNRGSERRWDRVRPKGKVGKGTYVSRKILEDGYVEYKAVCTVQLSAWSCTNWPTNVWPTKFRVRVRVRGLGSVLGLKVVTFIAQLIASQLVCRPDDW